MRATGMPLGLMPGMHYDEKEIVLQPGDTVLFYSDGLVEAHNRGARCSASGGCARWSGEHEGGAGMIPFLLDELAHLPARTGSRKTT